MSRHLKRLAADTIVVSFRMPTDEYKALEQAATAAGESIAEQIRKAVALLLGDRQTVRLVVNTSSQLAPYTHTDLPEPHSTAPRSITVEEFVRK